MLWFILLAFGFTQLACGQVIPPTSSYIPVGFYQAIVFNMTYLNYSAYSPYSSEYEPAAPMLQPITIYSTVSNDKYLEVEPSVLEINTTSGLFEVMAVYALAPTMEDVSVTVFTMEPGPFQVNETFTFKTFTPLCPIEVSTSCPQSLWFAYSSTTIQNPTGQPARINVTIQGMTNYDVFYNGNDECPIELFYQMRMPLADSDETPYTVEFSQEFTKENIDIRVTMQPRFNLNCLVNYTLVVFDPDAAVSGQNSSLICVNGPEAIICDWYMPGWQVAILVLFFVGTTVFGIVGYWYIDKLVYRKKYTKSHIRLDDKLNSL